MVIKKAIEFALDLMNLISSNSNNQQFIRNSVASSESSQLKKNGSSYRSLSIFWEEYWICWDSPLNMIVCGQDLLCLVSVLIRRYCQLQYISKFQHLNLPCLF